MKIKKLVIGIIAAMAAFVGQAESSTPFCLSLKSDGVRTSLGDETLTYSSQWNGGEDATVTIAQDGAVVADSLSGEGTRPWSVTRNGTYVLTHTTYTNGVAGKVETATFVVTGKDVPFAAEDVTVAGFSGKYDGAAHGVGVTVKEGIEDVVVRYAAGDGAPALPWSETAPTITDVGAMTVWCEIAAPGYITQTNSATVVISPREVTLTSGSASKVYDGTALANGNVTVDGDGFVDGEGASYNVTGSQTNVGESENVFTYTLSNNTKASNYNITTVNGTLTVTKANVGGGTNGDEEPGNGEVPQGGVSKFDVTAEYDGAEHTVDSAAILAAWQSVNAGVALGFALKDTATDWTAAPESFVDVCETSIWYKVTLANYEDFIKEVKVTITPRDIANVTVQPINDITFADAPVEPVPVVTDGDPSIVSTEDYTLSYEDNDAPGTAKLTLTGKNNYTGTKSISFNILRNTPDKALLKAEVSWKLLRATGTYFAQLKVACTNGLDAGLSDLRFVFADRVSDGDVYASLWDSRSRAAKSTLFSHNGDTYRYVALDAAQIQSENTETVFGVSDISGASIPVSERTIELYVRRRVDPSTGNEVAAGVDNFVGFVGWVSGGETNMIPVVSGAGSKSLSRLMSASPMAAKRLNTALAVGVALDSGSNPYCRLVEFSVEGDILKGKVEVGADTAGREAVGAIGKNAVVVLLGAAGLNDDFSEVGKIDVASDGSFTMTKPSKCNFFKLRIDVSTVVE